MPGTIELIMERYVYIFNIFISVYLAGYTFILLLGTVYGALDILKRERLENLHNILEHSFYYPISVLVPVYNEGETGVMTVENVLKQEYRLFEVIIIDDGSTDNSKRLMIDRFNLTREYNRPIRYQVSCKPINEVYTGKIDGKNITLISKINGGCKADAINAGINVCEFPYFLNMDGDEILQRDALVKVARAIMEDDDVIGVGGNIRISNNVEFENAMPSRFHFGRKILPDVQTLEYGRNFAGAKILHNNWNANLIISGGFGVFKKSAVIEVGGYDTQSLGEDFELTMRLHEYYRRNKKRYLMKYVEDSVCWTQAPENYRDLRKQRSRWQCGLIQTIDKYKKILFNPRYGVIGMITFPIYIIYELLAPTVMIMGWVAIIFSILLKNVNFPFVLIVYLIYVVFSIMLTMLSYVGNCYRKMEYVSILDIVRIIFVGLYEAFICRIYLTIINFIVVFRMKKTASTWESPTRVAIKSK